MAGTIMIVLGGLAVVIGVGGAALGGAVMADAAGDASSCGGVLNPCDESVRERGNAGYAAAGAGLGLALFGLLVVVIGVILVFLGASRSRREQLPPTT